jgi:ribosomal protein L40E
MNQPAIELKEQAPKETVKSPTGFVLGGTQKMLLLVLLGMLLYLRLYLRRRKKDRICAHCGERNPPHRQNCTNCSAPLMDLRPTH